MNDATTMAKEVTVVCVFLELSVRPWVTLFSCSSNHLTQATNFQFVWRLVFNFNIVETWRIRVLQQNKQREFKPRQSYTSDTAPGLVLSMVSDLCHGSTMSNPCWSLVSNFEYKHFPHCLYFHHYVHLYTWCHARNQKHIRYHSSD